LFFAAPAHAEIVSETVEEGELLSGDNAVHPREPDLDYDLLDANIVEAAIQDQQNSTRTDKLRDAEKGMFGAMHAERHSSQDKDARNTKGQ
jgi:hypothetical protein